MLRRLCLRMGGRSAVKDDAGLVVSEDDRYREVVAVAPILVIPCHFKSVVAEPGQRYRPVEPAGAIR